ncbi:MAG: helix-turn-helix domain-containing protein [Syntrophomonas sp.]
MAAKKPDSMDKRILKGEKTKSSILEAAVRLFSEKGFDGTSVKDITDAAGVPKSLFYHYFKSMEELFLDIIQAGSNVISPGKKNKGKSEGQETSPIINAVDGIYNELKEDKVNLKIIFLEALKNQKVFDLLLERLDHIGHEFDVMMPEKIQQKYDSKELAVLRLYYRILPLILLILTEESVAEYYSITVEEIKDLLMAQLQ